MATKSKQYLPTRTFINGVDNTTPLESENIANTLSECLNGEMINADIIKTRNGYTTVTGAKGNYIPREGIDYIKPDGTIETIVYLVSTTATGNSGILARKNGTTLDSIKTGLPDGIKPCMLQVRTALFVFTGEEDFQYDGTTTKQIGIDAPTVIPTIHSNISGDLNIDGHYLYVYTYYNTLSGAESSPSLPSATLDAGANGGITIQITPGNSLSDQIKVYRTVSGGSIFFLDGTADIDATTYESTISDAVLGDELEIDNERLPEPAKFAILLDSRLFVGGFASNPNRIHHSKIGINGSMFESFQATDFIDCDLNDKDKIIGLGLIDTKVGVVKEKKVGKLIPLDLTIGGLETGGSTKYLYRRLSDDCTGTNHHSIFEVAGKMGWLGKDNIYMTNGVDVVPIASRIRDTIRSLNKDQAYKASSVVISSNLQIIISATREGKTEPDYQLIAHYQNYPVIAWTMFSPGPINSSHPGLPIASIWETTINNQTEHYFGSSNSNGKVCRYNYGTNDDGDPIYFRVKCQWEPGRDAMMLKSFHSIKYLATTNSASPDNILNNTWEENGSESVVKTETATITTSTKWATAKWATFKWAGLIYSAISFFPNRKAYVGRFGFYNDDLDAQFAIKAMRLLYRIITE